MRGKTTCYKANKTEYFLIPVSLNIYFYSHNSTDMKFHLLFYSLWLSVLNTTAQDSSEVKNVEYDIDGVRSLNESVSLQVAIPSSGMQKAIENHMGNVGFGASLILVSNPFTCGRRDRNSPFRIGGELGYIYYGRFISHVNINGYRGDYKTSYGIANLNAIIRFRPAATGHFNPFVDVIAGGNFYISSTTENLNVIETALGIERLDFGGTSSTGFNKGIGLGFTAGSSLPHKARFFLRTTYNRGSTIKYVVRNSLSYDAGSNTLNYEKGRAPVEYFMVQIGIGM